MKALPQMAEQARSYHTVRTNRDIITYFHAVGRKAIDDYAPFESDTSAKTDHTRVSKIHTGGHEHNAYPPLQKK
jgi:hypothetical protein